MKYPKMIIFDYGHTLLYEPGHNTENGNRAIYNYIIKNPNKLSFEQFNIGMIEIFSRIKENRGDLEIHEHSFLKLAFDYLGIELSVPFEKAECIIWDSISKGAVMPYADKMIDYINENGIRSAVISNICFSEKALNNRIGRLLPNNKFEFAIASSEYVFKKPNRILFEIALQKSRLNAEDVWYCGDSIKADVNGAHNAGIFPVLYEGETEEENPFKHQNDDLKVDFDHIHIYDWRELIKILEEIK